MVESIGDLEELPSQVSAIHATRGRLELHTQNRCRPSVLFDTDQGTSMNVRIGVEHRLTRHRIKGLPFRLHTVRLSPHEPQPVLVVEIAEIAGGELE